MRIGIRAKVTALLVVVALLPLLATLAAMVIGGGHLRRETFGKYLQASAVAEARDLQVQLVKDIEKFEVAMHEPGVISFLSGFTEKLPADVRSKLDMEWSSLTEDSREMRNVLQNDISDILRRIRINDPNIAEMLLTDRFGQLVAATSRTDDFCQDDEVWWQQTYNGGKPRAFVDEVQFDASAGVWSVDICIPVMKDEDFLGVLKVVVGMRHWVGPDITTDEGVSAGIMLVRHDGIIIHRQGLSPLKHSLKRWDEISLAQSAPGWRLTDDKEIQAWAVIALPGTVGKYPLVAPVWTVVLYTPQSEALGEVYRLGLIMLIVGLGIIGALFLAGLYLVDRGILDRIRRVERATRQVAKGDLTHRIESGSAKRRRLFGADEIDDLANDFNEMVRRIEESHNELEAANELKMNFIRIASHELRTPISYLLGVAKLLKGSKDPARLLHALQTISSKAKRIEQIIQSMFKLMPGQKYSETLNYSSVNLSELLEDIYLYCHPFLEHRNQRLIIEHRENLPEIQADRDKLSDIVENLVMNAIKFTPDGGVIKIRTRSEIGDVISIVVQDQGPGISDADLPYIFEPFFSGMDVMKHSSGETGYQKKGMGLGLTIVKKFVELHGGTVSVSTGENGSTFTVSIPVNPPPREARPEEPKK